MSILDKMAKRSRSTTIVAATLLLLSTGGCGDATTHNNAPVPHHSTSTDAREHDFGIITQGQDVEHTFTIRNDSGQEVRFLQPPIVEMGCCMTAELAPAVLAPGGEARLHVSFKTRLKPGAFRYGVHLSPSVSAFPGDFTIFGTVTSSLVIDPIQLNFQRAGTLEFEVSGSDMDKTYKIKEVKTNSEHVSVTLKGTSGQRRTYSVTWDGKPIRQKSFPVVYVITDSKLLTWFPILIYTPETSPSLNP